MDIKIFDIVDWYGFRGRVMDEAKHLNYISTSSCGVVDRYHAELVESVTIPTFEIGDIVKVLPISNEEKTSYPLRLDDWYDRIRKSTNCYSHSNRCQ